MTTNWKKRGQALCDGKPNLTVKSSAKGPNHIGHPVGTSRGTQFADRNPMHDSEPVAQDSGSDAIRTRLKQKGVR